MSNNENGTCGIAELLQVILILQQSASCPEECLETCDRPVLGCNNTRCLCNTRPVMLYSCCPSGTTPITMPISKNTTTCDESEECSSVFRVEKIENCTATFRVLAPSTGDATYPYVSTNSFFTMNLDCLCCIRCLNDTYVENL